MSGRSRLIQKVRKNQCFKECTRILEDMGLEWELRPPTGKGHPFLLIRTEAGEIRQHIATTPATRSAGYLRTVSIMLQKLKDAGVG